MKKDLIFWVIVIIIMSAFFDLRLEMKYKKFMKEVDQKIENQQIFKSQTELLTNQIELSKKLAYNQKLICYAILGDDFILDPEETKRFKGTEDDKEK
jgi:hypothetical protein